MPSGYKGIFITTGKFSKDALKFGHKDSSRPIICIDGKKLVQGCIDKNIGFKSKPVFEPRILDRILEQEQVLQTEVGDSKNAIKKKISLNDVRARILPIPRTIFETLPDEVDSYEVLFENHDRKRMKINRERRFFGGITATYRKYGLLRKDGTVHPRDSYWIFDDENQLIRVYFEKEG